MTSVNRAKERIGLVRQLSNELAAYLYTLPEDVSRDPDKYASACDQWKIADVAAHLVSEAIECHLSIDRGLKGDISPPMGYRHLEGKEAVEYVISLREAFDEDVFPEFNTTCRRLNGRLASLKPAEYGVPVWRPKGAVPISSLIDSRALELAIHGWDIRYGLDRAAKLSQGALAFLTDAIGHWFRAGFQKNDALGAPIRYRFRLNDPVTDAYDVSIFGDEFDLTPSNDTQADVTFRCDTETYILFGTGRLPFARSVRRGLLQFEGDPGLASQFTDWFRPL